MSKVTTSQQSVFGNPAPEESKPKRSFGLVIALAVMGAVAATLGATQLVSFLQSNPANQPVAQIPPQPIAVPVETPVESPSSLSPITPQTSPSVSLQMPVASSVPPLQEQLKTPVSSPILSNSQGAVSLTDMKCLTTTANTNDESFVKGPENVTIGQEVVIAVAYLRGQSNYILKDSAAGAACLIASPNSNVQFHKLKLTFGLNNTNPHTGTNDDSAVVKLTVYRDKQKVGSKEVKRGDKQIWEVDVINVQNVALEAECIKTKRYNNNLCPSVIFTQADLE